ncbi:ribbon-helix-helix domain-containing protein [Brumicola blandensis]|uniref:CopG family transcriptional regulator n=1 Tax=Brumicola blandensis TaxID=3075611 RepID=A0AAW8QZN1_9ALTE|nr:CopG family transcriptional regulator [Alteromonas sp. W409]MDT0582496.1 CopG family transcriptional regulator [Alteromonas sp. W409]
MPRQSVTLTEKNDEWLRRQVDIAGDYANKSELINDLVRRARRAEYINQKFDRAEQSDFVYQSPQEMLAEFKQSVNDSD